MMVVKVARLGKRAALIGLIVSACLLIRSSLGMAQAIARNIPQAGKSARLQIEVTRRDVHLADKTGIIFSLTNTTTDQSFYVTKEINPLTGGFPFRDYFIDVKPPNSQTFLESVTGFAHGIPDERVTENQWLMNGRIVLLKPGETHSSTMDFTWESLLWFLKRENRLVSGKYAIRAVYYARRMPGEDSFRIPPLKESLWSNVVEVQVHVP